MRFGLGGLVGGPDASHVSEYVNELQHLLNKLEDRDYGSQPRAIGVFVSIDGSMISKEQSGVGSVRLHKPTESLHCSIYVPIDKWRGRTATQVREYIAATFALALNKVIARARKEAYKLDEESLRTDIGAVLEQFLSTEEHTMSEAHHQIIRAATIAAELQALKKILES